MEDDDGVAAIQLSFRGNILPCGLCYLVFKSPKQSFEFVSMMEQRWPNSRILKVEPGWIQNAISKAPRPGDDIPLAGKSLMQSPQHPQQTAQMSPARQDGEINALPRKKLRRLDPSDRPPDQDVTTAMSL